MHNITLISTQHRSLGACNPLALYQILQSIKPDVIFEELPPSVFHLYYAERSKSVLETEAVSRYLQEFKAVNIPVDADDLPDTEFFKGYANAMERVMAIPDEKGNKVKKLVWLQQTYTSKYGFSFINHKDYTSYTDKLHLLITEKLKDINEAPLTQAYQGWNELSDRREREILRNIYNYSKEHSYNKAVLLLGVGHRKPLKKKIELYQQNELPKLNWSFFGE